MDQWLRLYAAVAGGMGSIPGGRTKIPHVVWCGQKMEKKKKKKSPDWYIEKAKLKKKRWLSPSVSGTFLALALKSHMPQSKQTRTVGASGSEVPQTQVLYIFLLEALL